MRLLLRCDGGPGIGVGHVVRSLALAEEAVARGHEVALLGRVEGAFLVDLAAAVGPGLRLLGPAPSDRPTDLAASAADYDVLHVDHYDLPDGLLDALLVDGPESPRPVLSTMADGTYGARPADLVVDPTVDAQWSAPPAPARWHLRGSRFVALRRSVTSLRETVVEETGALVPRVLVVMGGVDPTGAAPGVVEALAATGLPLDVTVVASEGTRAALDALAASWSVGSLTVTDPVADLPARMARADLVVSAAGTSVWELCAMRRPMAVLAVVDNQEPGYAALLRAGAAVGLGTATEPLGTAGMADRLSAALADPGLRRDVAAAAGRVVDGLGAWRLVASFEDVLDGATASAGPGEVTVRPATPADAEPLWHWRNDPTTREHSRSQEPVPLESHLAWLTASLARRDRHLLVGEVAGRPVGTIRWDEDSAGEWEVSITVAPDSRGRGVAKGLLAAGEDWLADALDGSAEPGAPKAGDSGRGPGLAAYLAAVHTGNTASQRLFQRSGYLPDLPADGDGFERFVKF
ncbi:Spore coat polysaccharide biosynthesis protein SpsG, predicted glycosyltransferase [Pedococcus dokdonensis]|uniref:Spore coat polysaccharide biosynthesis protein SpsG, predicted glycosyltransferase n=1 Tax=Pedococcus dokdonensis TaxID=443156 RepID=A0A1H0RGL3_9MICO|nr:bifunctional UDP-2,4-diacetamido-2,4,6-trideoxy-beta-L-altropyranose hydrolase/GNAT family N-acetyltransferase [Pedococcus dokdonensis]SDP28555.1 Spore coat polysaccharide biosynthesis protein SpsG, predicted glycosyltransferase [Pedococcus dokdonensis]